MKTAHKEGILLMNLWLLKQLYVDGIWINVNGQNDQNVLDSVYGHVNLKNCKIHLFSHSLAKVAKVCNKFPHLIICVHCNVKLGTNLVSQKTKVE